MKLYRIGDKVVSRERLIDAIDAILEDRVSGATQEQAAQHAGVQRSFVSFLETLGELRRGPRVALVAFPVANVGAVKALAEKHGLDFVLVLSQQERESIETERASTIFNELLETLATLRDFDTVVLAASDMRVSTIEHILGAEVIGVPLGPSPLRHDVTVDIDHLDDILASVIRTDEPKTRRPGAVGRAIMDATELVGRWTSSRK